MKKLIACLLSALLVIVIFSSCSIKSTAEKSKEDAAISGNSQAEQKIDEVAENSAENAVKESSDNAKEQDVKIEANKGNSQKTEGQSAASSSNKVDKGNTQSKPSSQGTSSSSSGEESHSKPETKPSDVKKDQVTISITCNKVFDNWDKVLDAKKKIIPSNGIILKTTTVEINEGDTVFDVLLRETRKHNIPVDFVKTPAYGSVYIKGIKNLYEFDAGDLSGWMYSVNGSFPNYGCSKYKLKNGDKIKWEYTCNLGQDM